ncbi:hypothetical protein WICPIJ_000999 [Wickerhamomyces pijperi]|uniref:Uncharacterized protein n=1 Tax=Wickerhamomyces pijperi TaxID=599730 RepID=A0A9P8QEE9_WICPI|nr:hypothetical protein WICPIJ_000999 [Wickerhamomyces pijperi]
MINSPGLITSDTPSLTRIDRSTSTPTHLTVLPLAAADPNPRANTGCCNCRCSFKSRILPKTTEATHPRYWALVDIKPPYKALFTVTYGAFDNCNSGVSPMTSTEPLGI